MQKSSVRAGRIRFGIRLLVFCVVSIGAAPSSVAQDPAPIIAQNHPVLMAARSGDLQAVRAEIAQGVSVNSTDNYGQTLLSESLKTGHLAIAREILERGFNPRLIYRNGSSEEFVEIGRRALSTAASAGTVDVVEELLRRGATAYPKVYATDDSKNPVLAAIESDHPETVRILLAHDIKTARERVRKASYSYLAACKSTAMIDVLAEFTVDVGQTGSSGPFPTALHTYARKGWIPGLRALLQLGADPTKEDSAGATPEDVANSPEIQRMLKVAAIRTHVTRVEGDVSSAGLRGRPASEKKVFAIQVIEAALERSESAAIEELKKVPASDLDGVDDRGWTILNYALGEGFVKLASALVDSGCNPAHITPYGSAIVAFAASTGDIALVQKIVARKVDVDSVENGRNTALLSAVAGQDLPMVDALLALGAKPDPRKPIQEDAPWRSALMVAAMKGNIGLMERLLKAGADLHAVDSAGENVIFYVARSNNVDALNWLLNRGAYPQLKTPRGTNALTLAASLGNFEMVKALVGVGLTHPDALAYAQQSTRDSAKTQHFLYELRRKTNPDDPTDLWNRSELSTEDVRRFIAAGGDVNYADGCPTPLQCMAELGNAEAVTLLLEKGADPKKRGRLANSAPFLALHIRGLRQEENSLQVLRAFIEHGLAPDTREYLYGTSPPEKEPRGYTLLHFAVSQGYLKCAEYLLEKGANPTLASYDGTDAFDALAALKKVDETQREAFFKLLENHRPQDLPVPAPSRDLPTTGARKQPF